MIGSLLSGGACAQFEETHYFYSERSGAKDQKNYFRLTIDGTAGFSGARYIAGYYDERAVDLFFNELRRPTDGRIFEDGRKPPGQDAPWKPLDPEKSGSLVMILSTNASAVADTIGAFAENQAAADALTNLINRSEILQKRRSVAESAVDVNRSNSVMTEIDELLKLLPADNAQATTTEIYIRILNAVSRAMDSDRVFASLDEAHGWITARRATLGTAQ